MLVLKRLTWAMELHCCDLHTVRPTCALHSPGIVQLLNVAARSNLVHRYLAIIEDKRKKHTNDHEQERTWHTKR